MFNKVKQKCANRLARMETTIGFAHPDLNVQIDTQANPNT